MNTNTYTNDFRTQSEIIERDFPQPEDGKCLIAVDYGYSAVKGISPNKYFRFPSYAKKGSDKDTFYSDGKNTELYYRSSDGEEWLVGDVAYDDAVANGDTQSNTELFSRDHYDTDVFKVIVDTALAIAIKDCGQIADIYVQTGLPPRYIRGDSSKIRNVIAGDHSFELKMGDSDWISFNFSIDSDHVMVMPQPLGALFSVINDKYGWFTENATEIMQSNLVVFDPGFGTTDFYNISRGRIVAEKNDSFPDLAMKEVFSRVCDELSQEYGVEKTISQLQDVLKRGTVRFRREEKGNDGNVVSVFGTLEISEILKRHCKDVCREAVKKLATTTNYFADTEYLIVTGGTYEAWKDIFNELLKNLDVNVISGNATDTSLSNVYSNVRGYYFKALGELT